MHEVEASTARRPEVLAGGGASGASSSSSLAQEPDNTDGNVFGVRLNGLHFYFYVIPAISDAVLHAMATCSAVTATTTTVKRFEVEKGRPYLDWHINTDREIIIRILDAMNNYITKRGAASPRRRSLGIAGHCLTGEGVL